MLCSNSKLMQAEKCGCFYLNRLCRGIPSYLTTKMYSYITVHSVVLRLKQDLFRYLRPKVKLSLIVRFKEDIPGSSGGSCTWPVLMYQSFVCSAPLGPGIPGT